MQILYLVQIRRASDACRLERSGFVFALEITLLIRICILSNAIFLRAGFTMTIHNAPKNWFSLDLKCSQRDSNPRHRVGNPEY